LLLGLLLPLSCTAEQFVQLTAEIYMDGWGWWFFTDNINDYPRDRVGSIFQTNYTFRCIVGTNTWYIERTNQTGSRAYSFTGTNIIDHMEVTNHDPMIRSDKSIDGNPGRPGGVADLMTFDAVGRICWLALCSGSALKHEGRKVYPPSDFWKESTIFFSGWSDKTTVFEDGLGLPKSITLVTTNGQSVLQYQAHQTTNVLGWIFPLEFYLVQYKPTGTNVNWQVELTAKGRVTSIGVGTRPEIPAAVAKSIGK
jgi:hypothetical protein